MNLTNTTQGNETSAWTSPILLHTRIILYSLLLVWSLLGNVLVIAVVFCNQNLRTNMNNLIVNMAVSDLLVPLVVMPRWISIYSSNSKWLIDGPLGEALCKLLPFLSHISPLVSSISLVIIAFQRFMAVVYPQRGQILSRRTRWIAISSPWIVAMALYSPYFFIYRLTNDYGYTYCDGFWSVVDDDRTAPVLIFYTILLLVAFAVPLIVIITLYIVIIYKLRRSLDNVRGMMEEEVIRSRQRKHRKIFSMLITIVVLFVICWCPYTAYTMTVIANNPWSIDFDIVFILHFAFWYIWYVQAAINPCIYFVFLKDFRQGLKRLRCRKTTTTVDPISRQPRTTGGISNQEPTRTPPETNTTSL